MGGVGGPTLFFGPLSGVVDVRDSDLIFTYAREELDEYDRPSPPKDLGDLDGDGLDDFQVHGSDYSTEFSYLGIFYGRSVWGP
jgi:hypothetical protein